VSRFKPGWPAGATIPLIAACLGLSACSGGSSDANHSALSDGPAAEEPHAIHWGYEGEEGPEHWADLSDDFSVCRSGMEQSPIDLTSPELADTATWTEQIGDNVLTEGQRARVMDIVDNGHTIQVTNDVPMVAIADGETYELVQYHFHAPSEHTIDGRHYPLEVHLVHKSAAGELAVVGVLVEEGEPDALWEVILSALPEGPDDPRHLEDLDLDTDDIRPPPQTYYRYMGSLTTPPCSENVKWIVSAEIRDISPDQMARILARLPDNNRPVQPLNGRSLTLYSPENEL
jgi:carbonic anhydrase